MTQARRIVEQQILQFAQDLDKTGYNTGVYKQYFKSLTDAEFDKFMKQLAENDDFNLFFEFAMQDKAVDMDRIEAVAKKYKIPLFEHVAQPHKSINGRIPITKTPIPHLFCNLMRLQQMLDKKSAATSEASTVHPFTGQVIGGSKAAALSDTQTASLATTGQYDSIKELLGPRADDKVAKIRMLETIEKEGDYHIKEAHLGTYNKVSMNTAKVMMLAAGIEMRIGNKGEDQGLTI